MERDAIKAAIIRIFDEKFEIVGPGADDNLRDAYEFDSIDAIVLLEYIEELIDSPLLQEEKKSLNLKECIMVFKITPSSLHMRQRRCMETGTVPFPFPRALGYQGRLMI